MLDDNSLYSWKISSDNDADFEVEFEISSADSSVKNFGDVNDQIENIDFEIEQSRKILDALEGKSDRFINHADRLDYSIAVASGVISGFIDSLFVGDFSFDDGYKWGTEKIERFVIYVAKKQGCKGDSLEEAISFLEKNWQIVADKATNSFGGGRQHHLRDFSHHASPLGLAFSMLTQFTGKVYGTSLDGSFLVVDVSKLGFIGKSLPSKLFLGTIQWFFHLVSDVAGSSTSALNGHSGTGIPGPILSLVKVFSSLPIFKHDGKGISLIISKLFNGTLLGEHDEYGKIIKGTERPFDLRTELGLLEQLGKQAVPVMINECIVRAFYFMRRLHDEIKSKSINDVRSFKDNVNWNNVLPWKNRTIVRMLTVATGTFTAVDVTDAAIRSAIKTRGINPAFWGCFVLKVNFIGVGRFAMSVISDAKMGYDGNRLEKERQMAYNVLLQQMNVKIYYKQASTWVSAKDSFAAIENLKMMAEKTICNYCLEIKQFSDDVDSVKRKISSVDEQLRNDLLDVLD